MRLRDAEAGLISHLKPPKIWNFRIFPKIIQKYQPKLKTIRFVIFGVELPMSRNQFFNIFTSKIYSIFDNLKVITILRIWIFMQKIKNFGSVNNFGRGYKTYIVRICSKFHNRCSLITNQAFIYQSNNHSGRYSAFKIQ